MLKKSQKELSRVRIDPQPCSTPGCGRDGIAFFDLPGGRVVCCGPHASVQARTLAISIPRDVDAFRRGEDGDLCEVPQCMQPRAQGAKCAAHAAPKPAPAKPVPPKPPARLPTADEHARTMGRIHALNARDPVFVQAQRQYLAAGYTPTKARALAAATALRVRRANASKPTPPKSTPPRAA